VSRRARPWAGHPGSAVRDGRFVRMAELNVVADKDYLPLARTSAMQVAAVLEMPLAQVADLRLAVDEACTSFLVAAPGRTVEPAALTGARLRLRYDRYPDRLEVTVCGPAPPMWPTQDEFGWETLRAAADQVRAEVADGVGTLTLVEPLPITARGLPA
jgi:serine/threonine-protein kinase RsbW